MSVFASSSVANDFDGSKKSAIDAVQISVTASTSLSLSTRFTV